MLPVYKLKWYILSSCFLTVPWYLHQNTRFLRQYSPSWVYFSRLIDHVQSSKGLFLLSSTCGVCVTRLVKGGRAIRGWAGDERVLRGCVQNYSELWFIVPISGLNPIPSQALFPIGEWVVNIPWSCVIAVAQLQFWSKC